MPQQAGAFIKNTTLEFQILLRVDRKGFLLTHYQTINVKSCFTVPNYLFLIDFFRTISKSEIFS